MEKFQLKSNEAKPPTVPVTNDTDNGQVADVEDYDDYSCCYDKDSYAHADEGDTTYLYDEESACRDHDAGSFDGEPPYDDDAESSKSNLSNNYTIGRSDSISHGSGGSGATIRTSNGTGPASNANSGGTSKAMGLDFFCRTSVEANEDTVPEDTGEGKKPVTNTETEKPPVVQKVSTASKTNDTSNRFGLWHKKNDTNNPTAVNKTASITKETRHDYPEDTAARPQKVQEFQEKNPAGSTSGGDDESDELVAAGERSTREELSKEHKSLLQRESFEDREERSDPNRDAELYPDARPVWKVAAPSPEKLENTSQSHVQPKSAIIENNTGVREPETRDDSLQAQKIVPMVSEKPPVQVQTLNQSKKVASGSKTVTWKLQGQESDFPPPKHSVPMIQKPNTSTFAPEHQTAGHLHSMTGANMVSDETRAPNQNMTTPGPVKATAVSSYSKTEAPMLFNGSGGSHPKNHNNSPAVADPGQYRSKGVLCGGDALPASARQGGLPGIVGYGKDAMQVDTCNEVDSSVVSKSGIDNFQHLRAQEGGRMATVGKADSTGHPKDKVDNFHPSQSSRASIENLNSFGSSRSAEKSLPPNQSPSDQMDVDVERATQAMENAFLGQTGTTRNVDSQTSILQPTRVPVPAQEQATNPSANPNQQIRTNAVRAATATDPSLYVHGTSTMNSNFAKQNPAARPLDRQVTPSATKRGTNSLPRNKGQFSASHFKGSAGQSKIVVQASQGSQQPFSRAVSKTNLSMNSNYSVPVTPAPRTTQAKAPALGTSQNHQFDSTRVVPGPTRRFPPTGQQTESGSPADSPTPTRQTIFAAANAPSVATDRGTEISGTNERVLQTPTAPRTPFLPRDESVGRSGETTPMVPPRASVTPGPTTVLKMKRTASVPTERAPMVQNEVDMLNEDDMMQSEDDTTEALSGEVPMEITGQESFTSIHAKFEQSIQQLKDMDERGNEHRMDMKVTFAGAYPEALQDQTALNDLLLAIYELNAEMDDQIETYENFLADDYPDEE